MVARRPRLAWKQEIMDTFGSFIRRERERQGLSLDRAAARVGLSKSRLRELESGLSLKTGKPSRPTAENVNDLARGLGLDQDHLAGLAGLGYRVNPDSQLESALLAAFRSLPQEHRGLAVRILEAMREEAQPDAAIVPVRARAAEGRAGYTDLSLEADG